MRRYSLQGKLGDGTYGTVFKGICSATSKLKVFYHLTDEVVAVKQMKRKFYTWESCLKLKEVKALKALNNVNIIKVREVIREENKLYFVFEYMEQNLYDKISKRTSFFTEAQALHIVKQILSGLSYMHRQGFFHRDIKPENILISNFQVKIADLGLAREVRSLPPYTEYVSTRWYRAPELLLQSTTYNSPVDIWAVGCILFEVLTFQPLFPGKNDTDQLMRICSVLGKFNSDNTWAEAESFSARCGFCWPNFVKVPIKNIVRSINGSVTEETTSLIESILLYDPSRRESASKLLQHSVFLRQDSELISQTEDRNIFWNQQSSHSDCDKSKAYGQSQNISGISTEDESEVDGLLREIESKYFQNVELEDEIVNESLMQSSSMSSEDQVNFHKNLDVDEDIGNNSFYQENCVDLGNNVAERSPPASMMEQRSTRLHPWKDNNEYTSSEQKPIKKTPLFSKVTSTLPSPQNFLSRLTLEPPRKRLKRFLPNFWNYHRN